MKFKIKWANEHLIPLASEDFNSKISPKFKSKVLEQCECYITLLMVPWGIIFVQMLNSLLCSRSQEAILDLKRIRLNYLRTWFVPDVIAAFPIGYILLFAVKENDNTFWMQRNIIRQKVLRFKVHTHTEAPLWSTHTQKNNTEDNNADDSIFFFSCTVNMEEI